MWVAVLVAPAPGAATTGLPTDWRRGANFTAWWHDSYESAEAAQRLSALRATGTTDVALLATWYMDTGQASQVQRDPLKTPSDEGMVALARRAQQLGMAVSLKPHVDVRDGTFRADIAPQDVDAWFSSYRAMLVHYADLARVAGADMLVVGTELTSMSTHAAQWRTLIAEVRSHFGGRLTFAANWTDGADRVSFWRDLDYIGIDAYMPLVASDPNPSVETLTRAMCATTTSAGTRRYVAETADLSRRFERPVVLTEIGFRSQLGTASKPWGDTGGGPSTEAQQHAYEAAYRVWSGVPWMKGLYWWDWRATGGGGDVSYTPSGKPAEATMSRWNGTSVPPPTNDPCAKPRAPRGRPHLTLRAARGVAARGPRRLSGSFRRGHRACAQKVALRIQRRGAHRAWQGYARLRAQVRASGRYRAFRRLPAGRYRGRASATGSPCGKARSRPVRFTVRAR